MNKWDDNDPISYIYEALEWMKAERARKSPVRMRESDWNYLINRLEYSINLLESKDKESESK